MIRNFKELCLAFKKGFFMADEKKKIKQILVVDDEPDLLELYQMGLEKYGYNCLTAANGLEGIAILEKEAIDLVISDYRMPKSNGLDLFRKTKELYQKLAYPRIPFIMVTGFIEQDVVTALLEGVSAVHGKPVSLKLLVEDIKHLEETAYYTTQRVYIRRKTKLHAKIPASSEDSQNIFPITDISLGGMQLSGIKSPFLTNENYSLQILNHQKKPFSPIIEGSGKCVWQRFYSSDDGKAQTFIIGFSFDEDMKRKTITSGVLDEKKEPC